MKILLLSHYFPPEIGAPQARLSEMAKVWAEDGHEVEVLTGLPNHPTGVIPPSYRGRRFVAEEVDGYKVLRTWLYATPNEGIAKKTLSHLSFMMSSLLIGGWRVRRPDTIVVSSPTFFSIFSAWLLARVFRRPFVLEVRDLWPGIFVELGILRNRTLIGLLERLELMAYAAADLVVVVTDGFKDDLVSRGVPANKVEVITNGVDLDQFQPGEPDGGLRQELGADPAQSLVVYIGAHGISQGLGSVLEAAHLVGPSAHFAFVGEGANKRQLVADGAELPNVSFHAGVPRNEVLAILHTADVLLVPLRNVPGFKSFIPSKMFEFMASGTPVVGAVEGEPARILSAAGAVVVPPEAPQELAAALTRLLEDPEQMRKQSQMGREFVEANFDRKALARRYEDCLKAVAESSS